ncbi:acyloxyacyl hydrolase [Thalassospira xiamenensis]|nr:acyloxyacyl hydrolase [Thalassospira xiamenensis]
MSSVTTLSVISGPTHANETPNEWHVSGSYSTDQLRGVRAGYRITDVDLSLLDHLTWLGSPKLHVEAAVNYWENSNDHADNIAALTVSPVLSWQLSEGRRPLFLEAGIGASLIDDKQIGDRGLSTTFQFEDRIALSWQYSVTSLARLTLGYTHYSNADLDSPNDGLDFFSLTWSAPF